TSVTAAMTSITLDLVIFLTGTFVASFVTGLVGFAFGMVAAAVWLHRLEPTQTTSLIFAYALLVQGYAVWKLRRAIVPERLLPFVIGSAIGIPLAIGVLEFIPATWLRRAVGVLLVLFGLYNLSRFKLPEARHAGRIADASVGVCNG